MEMFFVTHNEAKFIEAKHVAEEFNLSIDWFKFEYEEIQENNLEPIAKSSCLKLIQDNPQFKDRNFFLEDAGLFIDSLNGFPGPYSSYIYQTLGNEGILKLMEGKENRSAQFKSVVAFFQNNKIELYKGITEGRIIYEKRGNQGFGFDPIFQPSDCDLAFAEMSLKTKNLYSHRQKSLRELFNSIVPFAKE